MNFNQAIQSGFKNYVNFDGRAPRSEYNYWGLFVILLSVVTTIIDPPDMYGGGGVLTNLVSIALFVPGMAVAVRRLHDIDKSWYNIFWAATIIGLFPLFYWLVFKAGDYGDNSYGPDPLDGKQENDGTSNNVASAKNYNRIVECTKDEFKDLITIKSKSEIRHDMADVGAFIGSAMKSYNNILDAASAGIQFLTLKPRYVESPQIKALVIDLNYTGNDWVFFRDGSMIFLADGEKVNLSPNESDTDVHSGGKVDENLYYIIKPKDFQKIANASNVQVQISGQKSKVEIKLNSKQLSTIKSFNSVLFDENFISEQGINPNGPSDKKEQESKTSKKVEKNTEDSRELDVKEELKKYKEMLDDNLITQEDYDSKKESLLNVGSW